MKHFRNSILWGYSSVCCLFFFLLAQGDLSAQTDTTGLVRYTPEYRFTDGIFIDFMQVRNNRPIAKSRILTTVDYNDPSFFNQILKQNKISYYDEMGVKREIAADKIWGFARNGSLYYRIGQNFNRIMIVGSICHFIGTVTTYNPRYYSPYIYDYYSYPYSPYSYGYPYSSMETQEAKQFILDFETGQVYEFTVSNVEALLIRDPQLYEEFMALSSRKKKQLRFMYVRRFNERNPLYLPANNQ
ncbi:MAG: hypothetical protein GX419_07690 [Bacteroidales bacterium]|nr:hypothetical protein [Bacteroidales bacterium]